MNKLIFILMVGLFLQGSTVAEETDSFESFRKKFVGTWKVEREERVTTVTWRADGTWASETVDSGELILRLSGVWWTHDRKLHGVCLSSNDPDVPRGVDEASDVVAVTDDYYVIKNWRGVLKKYTRSGGIDQQSDFGAGYE